MCSKLMLPRFERVVDSSIAFVTAGILGAVAPDVDMIYFYLVDHRQHHHHTYWTHYPIIWLILLCLSALWLHAGQRKKLAALAVIFSLNGVLHMFLDTIASDLWWFAPFWDQPFRLIMVPLLLKPWWLNFLVHWSFLFELCVILAAIIMWRRNKDVVAEQ
jgi:inner membrane protein